MNLEQLRARVRSLTGVLMPTLVSDTDMDGYVNEGYQGILGAANWRFLYGEGDLVTVASQAVYDLPTAVDRAETVAVPTGGKLRRRALDELDREPAHRRSGTTWAWAPQADGKVELFPVPAAIETYKVRGWTSLPDLTAGQSPVFASEYHTAVAYEAAAIVLEREGDDSGRSEQYREEVARVLARMGLRYLPDGGEIAYPPAGPKDDA